MARIGLLGAAGYTGRLVAAELARRGHDVVAAGREPHGVLGALASLEIVPTDVVRVDLEDRTGVLELLERVDALLTTAGPFEPLGRGVLTAAVHAGVHYVDASLEQPFLRWAHATQDTAARSAGVTAVPGAGSRPCVGDLLAELAARRCRAPREVHVAYLTPDDGLLGRCAPGAQRTVAGQLPHTGTAIADGRAVEELAAEVRRLAWFPRPVGPHHAVGWPGGEPVTVPRHVPGAATVRSYLAMPTWRAELTQLAAAAASRSDRATRALAWVAELGRGGPAPRRRQRARWACVAEVLDGAGRRDDRDGPVVRAWAAGHDRYHLTAVTMAAVLESVLAGRADPGVVPPALAGDASDILDHCAAASDLRWSVTP